MTALIAVPLFDLTEYTVGPPPLEVAVYPLDTWYWIAEGRNDYSANYLRETAGPENLFWAQGMVISVEYLEQACEALKEQGFKVYSDGQEV